MFLKALYADTLDPLDLSSCTEIKVALLNADGSTTLRLLTLGQVAITPSPLLGKFSVIITSGISALLAVGELQSFDVTFTIAGSIFTVQYQNALSVFS